MIKTVFIIFVSILEVVLTEENARRGDILLKQETQAAVSEVPLVGYLINGLIISTILLLAANVLNIDLFPSVTQVQKCRILKNF